jgi:two-component system, NarL family, invasion response regulator UvrY
MIEAGPPVRVLVADDQEPFRRAARTVLGATSGFEHVGEARSGEEAVELAASLEPDLVMIDIHMPGIGGIEASRRISGPPHEVVTMLLSTYREGDLPEEARSCPAIAYVHKEDFGPRVLSALWAGRPSLPPQRGRATPPLPAYGRSLPMPGRAWQRSCGCTSRPSAL